MKQVFILLVSLLLASVSMGNVGSKLSFKKDKGKVEFKAKGWPSLLKINGKGEGFVGDLTSTEKGFNGDISFDLRTLKTGIDMRDDHLKNKYLKVKQNPTATLKIVNLKIPKKGKIKFNAVLKLNGTSKTVKVSAKVVGKKDSLKVNANFKLKLSDFNVEIPSFKGVTVAEEVDVKVSSKVTGVTL